jgi:hypothetical protein
MVWTNDDSLLQATVASVKNAFSSLRYTQNEILLFVRFEEYNDVLQITEDLWPDLLPSVMLVYVVLDRSSQQQRPARRHIRSGMQSKLSFGYLRVADNISVHSFREEPDRRNDYSSSRIL